MKTREELDELAQGLRERVAAGEGLDPATEALRLRGSGLSVVETGVILAKGLAMRLADAQELLVRLAASGEDRFR
ncbi:hypothetical protein L1785_13495 [Antribacter sp. KLBMP9083]|uniref:Uncharacterized protein n=1 Tax=Antribacter soli TaxID=2910976 RepID=A0AA41U7F3_9MICO|nr:hypothetical protein [Antribacter soli]MCF4121993.1 hypothetical protein [Antribacter soli]